MENNNLSFERNLIKGRIAETVFYLMFAKGGQFTITPYGYEHTIPALAQYQHDVAIKPVLETIRKSSDFILISQDKHEVFFVEVKYRTTKLSTDVLKIAQEITTCWSPVWLFLASPTGFFFDSCSHIIDTAGDISPLQNSWIPTNMQEQYLALLNECLCLHSPTHS